MAERKPDLIAEVRIPGNLAGRALQCGLKDVLGKCNVKFSQLGDMELTEKNAAAMAAQSQPEAEAVPAEKPKYVSRRMVKFICPKCGRVDYKNV